MSITCERPWRGVWALDQAMNRRTRGPRELGVTMVIDIGLGAAATDDILDIAAAHIDHWKFGFGTSALMPEALLRRKLAALAAHDIVTYPGGTLLEAAIVQQHCRIYMRRARELGFKAVEISEGTISLPGDRRRRVIDCAHDAGLIALTEVGKKDPEHQPEAEELAEQALKDLDWGATWVVVEGRESGRGVGIYDESGEIRCDFLEEVAGKVGAMADRLIWEAPQKNQQAALIRRFGANVSLGNIDLREILALETLRSGLRFETFAPIAEHSAAVGKWDPSQVEAEDEAVDRVTTNHDKG